MSQATVLEPIEPHRAPVLVIVVGRVAGGDVVPVRVCPPACSALKEPCSDGGHKPYWGEDVYNPPEVTSPSVVQ